jgi:hypothetical protein
MIIRRAERHSSFRDHALWRLSEPPSAHRRPIWRLTRDSISMPSEPERNVMIKDFNVSEKGHGSYWLLGILRWVMVLIFISFGIQKFTPQSAQGIALYISNSPFVSWLSVFGIRGEAYLLGTIELTTRHYSRCRRVYPDSIGTRLIDGNCYFCDYVVVFLLDTRCCQMEHIHRPNSLEPHRGILV